MAETKLKPAVFKYIESELYDYPETKKEIARVREQIICGNTKDDENIGGGRSSEPGRPTERLATRLLNNRSLDRMQIVVTAIESAYEKIPDDHKKVIRLKYWDSRKLTMEGIACECYMHRNTAAKYRRNFVYLAAERMGYIVPIA